jgi:hypothetical protein
MSVRRSGSRPDRLRGKQLPDYPAEHLPGCHPASAGGSLKLHCLPQWQQKSQLDDFLIGTSHIGRDGIEQRLHGVTCPGRRVRRVFTAGVTGHYDPQTL